jgi:hypothetical protein
MNPANEFAGYERREVRLRGLIELNGRCIRELKPEPFFMEGSGFRLSRLNMVRVLP